MKVNALKDIYLQLPTKVVEKKSDTMRPVDMSDVLEEYKGSKLSWQLQ